MKSNLFPSVRAVLGVLPLLAGLTSTAGLLSGCAGSPSGDAAVSADRRRLLPEERLRHAAQDSVRVPEKADALLLAHPFASNQLPGIQRTLAQIYVRVRSAGPDLSTELAGRPDGTPYLGAQLTIEVAPGFRLVRFYGVPAVDSAAGVYRVRWDTLALGEWKTVLVEVEGHLPPSAGKERLVGATLRTTRLADGGVFETIDGTGMEWQNASPAKLNAWTARNSLYAANAEALREADRLAAAGSPGRGLALLDLQLLAIQSLKDLDPQGIAREEESLLGARSLLAARVPGGPPAPQSLPADSSKQAQAIRAAAVGEQSAKVDSGIWTTLAQLFAVRGR